MMGGDIAVTSELGKGTTFTVTLPVEVNDPELTSACGGPGAQLRGYALRPRRLGQCW